MAGMPRHRRVPLAWRNLTADWRRLLASVTAVGLAVMLILLLTGMWEGMKAQTHVYTDHAGADLYVLQPGMRELMDEGVLPTSTLDTVRQIPGVSWASPARGVYVTVDLRGTKVMPYVVGTPPGAPGGAWSISQGRAVRADDEMVVDSVLAHRFDIGVGDTVTLTGRPFRVVGLSSGTSGFMTSYIFVTHAATDSLFSAPGTTSYILVGASDPAAVEARLSAAGLNVLTASQVAANTEDLETGMFGGPILMMVVIAFGAGTLVIALTAYTTIIDRRREYGIVKALGARRRRLVGLAISQTVALALLGLVAGGLLFLGGQQLIAWARPQFAVVFTSGALVGAAAAALGMALVAAIVPARRLARLDPASAYRGT